jgi:hypothetical protein
VGLGELLLEPGHVGGFRQRQLRRLGRRGLLEGGVLLAEIIEKTRGQRLAELEHSVECFGRLLRCNRHPYLLFDFDRRRRGHTDSPCRVRGSPARPAAL